MQQISYKYRNCPIPGGGFVTGLVFHEKEELLYARTDIGGIYRRDFTRRSWIPLNDSATSEDAAETYPLSLALDTENTDSLYAVCGDGTRGNGYLMLSRDRGASFIKKPLPCEVHGNRPGRSTGERLLFDKGSLYFASQTAGLLKSENEGENWVRIPVMEQGRDDGPEENLTFIWKRGNILAVGCSGAANRITDIKRGNTLYISYDEGAHFTALPVPKAGENFDGIAGFVPQHCCFDGSYLYVTFLETEGKHYQGMDCYSFDTGACHDGRVWRYQLGNKCLLGAEDITPVWERLWLDGLHQTQRKFLAGAGRPGGETAEADAAKRFRAGGFSGIDCRNGMLVCSTGGRKGPDIIFMSTDQGEHWKPVLCGLEIGRFHPESVPYMKPEYNGGGSILHWLSDIRINPFHPSEVFVTSGTGIFSCRNLEQAAAGGVTDWYPDINGLEETVHLNVYSLPEGPVKLVDIVGDLGGFAFREPSKMCENSFADEKGNRYITCLNADFPEQEPYLLVTAPRGNWTGRTKGGVILSYDQGLHFEQLSYPYGISGKIDGLLERIQQPNVDSGYVAVSADGARIIWAIAEDRKGFPSDCAVYLDRDKRVQNENKFRSEAAGAAEWNGTWKKSVFYGTDGAELSQPVEIHPYADRVNPEIFYAFGNAGRIFISRDKGRTFWEKIVPQGFPKELFLSRRIPCQVTMDYDKEGISYLAVTGKGLYRLLYQADYDALKLEILTKPGEYARCVGLGCPLEEGKEKAIYLVGRLAGQYGFYRSGDNGKSFARLNTGNQMYGDIRAVCGDRREAGRFYLATGSRGLLYGTEAAKKEK